MEIQFNVAHCHGASAFVRIKERIMEVRIMELPLYIIIIAAVGLPIGSK